LKTEKVQVKPDWANISEGETGIDIECLKLCEAMNKFPGIKTVESCCGHSKRTFKIWFVADNLESLPVVVYFFDGCHCGSYKWEVIASTDCGMSPIKFMVEGPKGKTAYQEADKIAALMEKYLSQPYKKEK
jgi:hypothetical protein